MCDTRPGCEEPEDLSAAERRARRRAWANLVRRVFEVDPLICERCGAVMKIISVILDPEVIDAILRHLRRTKAREAQAPPPPGTAVAAFVHNSAPRTSHIPPLEALPPPAPAFDPVVSSIEEKGNTYRRIGP